MNKNIQPPHTETTLPHGKGTESTIPLWGYNGKVGPSYWGKLEKAFSICGRGIHQSPINLQLLDNDTIIEHNTNLSFHYKPARFSIINNGHTIQLFADDETNFMKFQQQTYTLVQFHFHTPSEHTIDEQHKEMELHFVHRDNKDKIVVIALLVTEGTAHSTIQEIWNQMPNKLEEQPHSLDSLISTNEIIPKNWSSFQYVGSLTTPPCTEEVQWIVLTNEITLSREQIEKFRTIFPHNNRPIQPINGREIIFDTEE